MAFQAGGFVENAQGLPAELQQFVGDHHPGGERRRARSHALAQRNLVVDVQFDGRHGQAVGLRHGERGLPDQVVGVAGNGGRIAAGGVNGERLAAAEPAGEVDAQGQPEGVETRPQVGAGGRHPQV